MSPKDFHEGESLYRIGVALSRIDIIQSMDAVDFKAAWVNSEAGMAENIPIRYISIDDLIRNKLAVGRLRDLADVEDLQASKTANSKPRKPDAL